MHTASPSLRLPRRGSQERLTFNYPPGGDRHHPPPEPSFATVEKAESRDWGYLGLLAFTAVLLLRPEDRIPSLSSVHVAELCAFVGIGPMLLHRFARRLPVFRVTPETIGLIAFGGVMLATAPFSVWPGGALAVFTGSYLKIVIVFVLMMNTLTTTARLERLMWLILACIGVVAALSLANYARGVNLVEGGRLAGAVGGIFGNPNDLAMNMVTFLPAAIVVAWSPRHSGARRLAAAAIAALMLATIVLTKSRGGMLGVLAVVLGLVVLGRTVRRGFGAVTIVAILVAMPFVPSSFWARMSSITNEREDMQFTGSREARETVMLDGIETFLDHPLTGVGAGQFKNYNPPQRQEKWLETHNALIQVAAETGVLGLLAFAFLIARAASAAWVTRRIVKGNDGDEARALSEHTLGLSAGLFGWFVCALFASVAYNWTFYYLLALLVAGRELAVDRVGTPLPQTRKKISTRAATCAPGGLPLAASRLLMTERG